MRNCYYFFVVVFTEVLIKSRTLTGGFTVHTKAVAQRHSVKKMFLEISQSFAKFTGKHLCQSLFVNKVAGRPEACNVIKKEALAQVFSCEFCETSNNTFSYRAPPLAAS